MTIRRDRIAKITQEKLMSEIMYNPAQGHFSRVRGGSDASKKGHHGYKRVRVDGCRYYAHRLAWFYIYGVWPKRIDHINRDTGDNRICNLREATALENMRNCRMSKNNKSGVNGVCWNNGQGRWMAYIKLNNKNIHLGLYANKKDAAKARRIAEKKLGFSKGHGR